MQEYLMIQLFIASFAYIGQILVGYGMGWTAPITLKLQNPEESPLPAPITEKEASWVASVIYIGVVIGPHVSGFISNKYGRKPALFMGGFLTVLSFVLLATAVNFVMIIAGRILVGLGTGVIFVVNLVYLGEIASTNIRGLLLTGTTIFTTFGTLLVYAVGPYISYALTSYIAVGIAVIYLIGICFIPETPVFHTLKDNEELVRETLIYLGRKDEVLKDFKSPTKKDQSTAVVWKELFMDIRNRKALSITMVLSILQQLSGAVVVTFFATTIFALAGSTVSPNIATIIIGLTQMIACIISSIFVERLGRKLLLLWSTSISCLSLLTLGTYFYLDYINLEVQRVGWLPLVCLVVFFLAYNMGFGVLPGTLTGELFGNNVRSTGSAVVISMGWLFGFGLSTAFGYMITSIGGHFTFWIFAGSCSVAFVFTFLFVPETRGKSFTEIQEILSR